MAAVAAVDHAFSEKSRDTGEGCGSRALPGQESGPDQHQEGDQQFDDQQGDDDLAVQTDGVTLLVDPLSLQYLMGAEVDYTESLHGAQFVIRNPNAKTTCGCGSSFSA